MGGTQRTARTTLGTLGMAGVGALVAALVALALPAGAQDPYGSTTTTAGGASAEASCSVSVTSGQPGDPVTATVVDVEVGTTVRLLFGGEEVGRATAPGQGTGTTSVTIAFEVPDREPGQYLVTAVGPDFTATCNAEAGGQFEVLSASVSNSGQGRGSLPRTGVYVALLVTIAIGLLLLGRSFVDASRRRRRRAHRAAWNASDHLHQPRQHVPK